MVAIAVMRHLFSVYIVEVATHSSMTIPVSATKELADMAYVTTPQRTLCMMVWKITLHLQRLQTWLLQQCCNELCAQTLLISIVYGVLKGNIQQTYTDYTAKLQSVLQHLSLRKSRSQEKLRT